MAIGSGWLYKQDIKIGELRKQQSVIVQYLNTVDKVLFGGRKGDLRGVGVWAGTRGFDGREKGGQVRHYLIRT